MATEVANANGITITEYARPTGMGYQVTWGVDRWVSFSNVETATVFMRLLARTIERA